MSASLAPAPGLSSNLQDPLPACDARSAGANRFQNRARFDRLDKGVELGSGSGELDGVGALGDVDDTAAKDVGHALHLLALLAGRPNLDQHELALDVCRLGKVDHLDYLDKLI